MSRTGNSTWRIDVPRRDQGPVPLRIAVRGRTVAIQVGSGTRPLLLDAVLLQKLLADLTGAQRVLGAADAAGYIAQIGRERYGPPAQWPPVPTPEEIEAADREDDQ